MTDPKPMTDAEIKEFYARLSELTATGTEEQVREYFSDHYLYLPEDTRNDIVFNVFSSAIQDERAELAAVSQLQEEGLVAAETLEAEREVVKREQDLTE